MKKPTATIKRLGISAMCFAGLLALMGNGDCQSAPNCTTIARPDTAGIMQHLTDRWYACTGTNCHADTDNSTHCKAFKPETCVAKPTEDDPSNPLPAWPAQTESSTGSKTGNSTTL